MKWLDETHGLHFELVRHFLARTFDSEMFVALQGVLLNFLPASWFARVSTWAQAFFIAAFFFGGLLSWAIVNWRQDMIARLPEFAAFAPPVWFGGLHEAILGRRDPFFAAMATRA